jgi:CubicO group peptidase (beta-lactamase class C family)
VKRLIQWAAVAIGVVCLLVVAREPEFWKRTLTARVQGPDVPLSYYQPRERVEGDNRPAAPRVGPALEQLDVNALQAGADYAAKFNSDALMVTRHGHIVFERYWHGTHFDTLVDSQSFVRTLNAVLVGIAIDQRRIGWPDEPIGYLIPELNHDPRGTITVRNLLQDSSGLDPRAGAGERFGSDIARGPLEAKLTGRPGWSWADQGTDTQLLAIAIERATKQRYAEFLSVALWRRLGAADAWLWLDRPGGSPHVDCCFLAQQGDWLRLGELLANDGRFEGDEIVTPKWVIQMLAPAKGNPSYGSSLKVKPGRTAEAYASPDVFLVEGRGHRMWIVPSMGLVILRTGSTLGAGWDDSRIPNLIIRGARDYVPAQARPGVDLRDLVPSH